MSLSLAVQSAVYTKLDASLTTPVYDNAPQQSDSAKGFPYVTIGEDVINEWDTDTELGGNPVVTIHTWSRYRGRKETKEIQAEIYDALHRAEDLSYAGFAFITIDFLSAESFMDTDGLTRHGVSTFRVYIEEI